MKTIIEPFKIKSVGTNKIYNLRKERIKLLEAAGY
jgi:hypothetical protein